MPSRCTTSWWICSTSTADSLVWRGLCVSCLQLRAPPAIVHVPMRFRPLFALLTSVTMLRLSVAAGDAACATHGVNGHRAARGSAAHPTEHATAMHGHMMPMAHDAEASVSSAVPIAKSGALPCEVPTQQRCCEALVGCSVDSAVSGAREVLAAVVTPAARIRVAPDDVPTSFAPAPEPPPPRA